MYVRRCLWCCSCYQSCRYTFYSLYLNGCCFYSVLFVLLCSVNSVVSAGYYLPLFYTPCITAEAAPFLSSYSLSPSLSLLLSLSLSSPREVQHTRAHPITRINFSPGSGSICSGRNKLHIMLAPAFETRRGSDNVRGVFENGTRIRRFLGGVSF